MAQYALGLDFGTNSVRALIVNCPDGTEIGAAVANYASGTEGVLTSPLDQNLARQNPADYPAALAQAVSEASRAAAKKGFSAEELAGIGVDTTGSTPIPVHENGMPV